MSDRIKKIKIKQADGTFSDYIPIGANAKDIDLQYNDSNVENTLKKKPYYYDSVAAMKLDDTLKEGDMAITLGYYEANDGGGAEYKIVNKESLEDDGGSIHELNNGLKAQLIMNELNIRQFGAKGDGITDDTITIQRVLDLGKANKINNFYNGVSNIIFPTGKYLISNTLIMSPFCKIKTSGQVYIIGNNINGSVLCIKPSDEEKPNMSKLNYLKGFLIDGSIGGFIIMNNSRLSNGSIGLEIGALEDTPVSIANTGFSNISITDFDTNMLINNYNIYILSFISCQFETSNCNIKFGSGYQNTINTGERITFIDCNISSAKIGVQYNTTSIETMFENCSFDFLYCCFNTFGGNKTQLSDSKGFGNYARIFCSNCHFEALGHENFQYIEINERDPYGLIYNYNDKVLYEGEEIDNKAHTTLSLNNCAYYMSTINKQLFNTIPYDNLDIFLSNFIIRDNIGNTNAKLMFLGGDNKINIFNYGFNIESTQPLLTKKHNITNFPEFENLDDEMSISNSDETVTDSFKFSNFNNITSTAKITSENSYSDNGKSLAIQVAQPISTGVTENAPSLDIDDNIFYDIGVMNKIYSTVLFKNKVYTARYKLDILFNVDFYDVNKNLLSTEEISNYSISENLEYGCSYSAFLTENVPNNARYFKIRRHLSISGINGGLVQYHTFYITGLYTFLY